MTRPRCPKRHSSRALAAAAAACALWALGQQSAGRPWESGWRGRWTPCGMRWRGRRAAAAAPAGCRACSAGRAPQAAVQGWMPQQAQQARHKLLRQLRGPRLTCPRRQLARSSRRVHHHSRPPYAWQLAWWAAWEAGCRHLRCAAASRPTQPLPMQQADQTLLESPPPLQL